MKSILKRTNLHLQKFLKNFVALIMLLLVVCVLYGVATRYILGNQATFTDELARMLLIFATFFGASYAFATKANIALDYFMSLLSKDANILSKIISDILVIIFIAMILIFGGIQFVNTSIESGNHLISINIYMWQVYLCVPISGVFMMMFALEGLSENITNLQEYLKTQKEL